MFRFESSLKIKRIKQKIIHLIKYHLIRRIKRLGWFLNWKLDKWSRQNNNKRKQRQIPRRQRSNGPRRRRLSSQQSAPSKQQEQTPHHHSKSKSIFIQSSETKNENTALKNKSSQTNPQSFWEVLNRIIKSRIL